MRNNLVLSPAGGRSIVVKQQVQKNAARTVEHLKTNAARREIDLHPDIAEFLRW